MRRGFAFGLAVVSFGLGAWLSPAITAQDKDSYIPVRPERGQQVIFLAPGSTTCEVERVGNVSGHWVMCKDGTWRNLINGSGYSVEKGTR